jgi:hypothetical protein
MHHLLCALAAPLQPTGAKLWRGLWCDGTFYLLPLLRAMAFFQGHWKLKLPMSKVVRSS